MSISTPTVPDLAHLHQLASTLKLHGLLAHWDELTEEQHRWTSTWLEWEEHERTRRTLERRMSAARIGTFKPLSEFDWQWPKRCDKAAISEAMTLGFVKQAGNIVLLGSNGLGKSTIAQNITYQAVMHGHSALYVNAAHMLGDLAAQDGDLALRRRIKHYARPDVLTIDEIGYMTYGDRHADLLFEIINRRYETKSTVVTTNKAFGEWADMFPNNGSVVAIVDRLVHHSDIIVIEGDSYRMHEAKQRASKKRGVTNKSPSTKPANKTTNKEPIS